MTQWSEIIPWGKLEKPDLPDDVKVQRLYINANGDIVDGWTWETREKASDMPWVNDGNITLAYRYEIKPEVLECKGHWDVSVKQLYVHRYDMDSEDIPLVATWDQSKAGQPDEFTLRRAE